VPSAVAFGLAPLKSTFEILFFAHLPLALAFEMPIFEFALKFLLGLVKNVGGLAVLLTSMPAT